MMLTGATMPPADGDSQGLNGPVAQSIRIAFCASRVAMVLLALYWAVSNIRQIPPDAQAVVIRFGEVVRIQQAGLVMAWPRPIEHVELLPSADRQMTQPINAGITAGRAIVDPVSRLMDEAAPAGAGIYLTGDGGVVLLDATLTYRIDDPAAWYLARDHVAPALRRLYLASAVALAAGHAMDDFIVVRSEQASDDPAARRQLQIAREAVRAGLVAEINRRLRLLTPHEASLGVEVTRADVSALLPPAAKFAFDAVLEASQMADQGLAAARTDAARTNQAADQERDRVLTAARASADERVGSASAHVAAISALEQRIGLAGRPSLLDQLYRERIAGILHQAGGVNTIDANGGSRVILPGGLQ